MLETIIIEPANQPTHALIWLHGLGADGHDFELVMPQLQPKGKAHIRFVLPHAPLRPVSLFNGMPARAWFDLSFSDEGFGVNYDEVNTMAQQIESLIQTQIEQGIARENILLGGFSQGGAIAIYTALTTQKTLGGLIGLSTFMPIVGELASKTTQRFPVFIAHGETDTVVPYQAGHNLAEALKQAGFVVNWEAYPIAHSVCAEEIEDLLTWISKTVF